MRRPLRQLVARAPHQANAAPVNRALAATLLPRPSTVGRRATGPFGCGLSGSPPKPRSKASCSATQRAFTGATSRKAGLVEAAGGGTPVPSRDGRHPSEHAAAVSLLETGKFHRRVGSTELPCADIRPISATHRPPKALVESGQFRQDLYR